jgi:hypothetical protein
VDCSRIGWTERWWRHGRDGGATRRRADTLEGSWDSGVRRAGIVFSEGAFITVTTRLLGDKLSGRSTDVASRAETVTEILGQEVRVAPGQSGRMGACDFDLVVDPTIQVELRVQPGNLADMVYDGLKMNAKAMLGQTAEPNKIDLGEGGLSWGSSNSGGEAAATANGNVYHARLAVGIMSSFSVPEEAIVKLVERMIP